MEKDCVFCDRTKFEERLICESEDFYVIATLGQITDGGYVLLVPKKHVPCMGALTFNYCPNDQTELMLKMSFKVSHALSLEYQQSNSMAPAPITVFEHGIIGQTIKHAHFHFLPAVIDLTPKIRADFPESEFEELKYAAHLQELYNKCPRPYLFWTVPGGGSMVCWNPPAPPQYLRLIAAELLGRPKRGNWRDMDPEMDKQLWTETVTRLKPHFL